MTQTTKEIIDRAITFWEANELDGDKIYDCGKCTILVDKDFEETLRSTLEFALQEQREEIVGMLEGMKQHDMTNVCDCGKVVEFAGEAYNQAVDNIIEQIKDL